MSKRRIRELLLFATLASASSTGAHAAGCTTPPGTAGDIIYNSSYNVMQFCNGTQWINMGSASSAIGALTNGDFCTASGGMVVCSTQFINLSSQASGTLQAAQFPALTGDVTTSAGSLATTVGAIGGKAVSLGGAFTTAGTLTFSGAFSVALTSTAATSLTLPTSGTLIATTTATPAQGDILYYNGSAWVDLGAGTSGNFLETQGASANPKWAPLALGTGSITGVFGVAQGGTGDGSLTTHAVLLGEGTNPVGTAGPGNGGQILIGQGASTDPAFETVGGDITLTSLGTASIGANKVTTGDLAQIAGLSVLGNSNSASGNVGAITGTANQVLTVGSAGTSLIFGAVNLASASAVTGNLPVANLAGGSGASSSTFWRGDGSWAAISVGTGQIVGTIGVAQGGTGDTTLASDGVLYGNGTGAVQTTGAGAEYNVLVASSGGAPSFGQVALNQSAAVTGTLAVANGGTGLGSLTGNVIYKANSGGSAFVASGLTDNATSVTSAENIDIVNNALLSEVPNGGTVAGLLAKLNASGNAVTAGTSDIDGMLGVVVGSAGGNAQIASNGQAECSFDGGTSAGDYVTMSTSVAGDCHDAGATRPTSGEAVGRVLSTNSGAGSYAIAVEINPATAAGAATGTGTPNYDAVWTGSSTLGTGVLYESGGKIGIGTTSPSVPLTIYTGTGSTTTDNFEVQEGGTNGGFFQIYSYLNAVPRMVMQGNIGTGSLGSQIEFRGNAQTDDLMIGEDFLTHPMITSSGDLQLAIDSGSTGTGQFEIVKGGNSGGRIGTDGTSYFKITNAGKVGIGTTAPGNTLDINGGAAGGGVRLQGLSSDPNYYTDLATSYTNPAVFTLKMTGGLLPTNAATTMMTVTKGVSTVFNTGNVGIGTTAPTALLQVWNASAAFTNLSGGAESITSTNVTTPVLSIIGTGAADLFRLTGLSSAPVFYVQSGGNVGIGTTSPLTLLNVANPADSPGAILISGSTIGLRMGSGQIDSVDKTGFASYQPLSLGGSTTAINISGITKMFVDSSGDVGIGTTSPGSLLQVATTSTGSYGTTIEAVAPGLAQGMTNADNMMGLVFGKTIASGEAAWLSYHYDTIPANSYLGFGHYGSSEAMVLTQNGTLGIGTTGPLAQEEIYSTSSSNMLLTTSGTTSLYLRTDGANAFINNMNNFSGNGITGNGLLILTGQTGIEFNYGSAGSVGSNAMFIGGTGLVGIGSTSPVVSLDLSHKTDAVALPVGNTTNRPIGTNLANGEIRYNTSTPGIEAYVNGAWVTLLDSSGTSAVTGSGITNYVARWTGTGTLGTGILYDNGTQVGIGTTAPAHTLDVAGSAWVSGNSAFGGTIIDPSMILTAASNINNPAATTYAINGARTLVLTAANSNEVFGVQGNVSTSANAFNATGELAGGYFQVSNANTATVSKAYGSDNLIYNTGTGTVANGAAGHFQIQNLNASGVIVNAYGAKAELGFNNGTMTNTYGFYAGTLTGGTQTNQPYAFYAADSNAYSYFAGKVGIGTTAPAHTLHVLDTEQIGDTVADNGSLLVYGTAESTATVTVQGGTSSASLLPYGLVGSRGGYEFSNSFVGGNLNFKVSKTTVRDTTAMTISSSGTVGIGTTSPSQTLYVAGGNIGIDTAQYLYSGGVKVAGSAGGNSILGSVNSTWIQAGGANQMYLAPTSGVGIGSSSAYSGGTTPPANGLIVQGNVGIGTTSPGKLLDVYTTGQGIVRVTSGGTTSSYFQASNTGGNTFIGNETSVAGTTFIGSLAYASFLGNDSGHALQFGTGSNIRMTIDPSGDVGIGTTSPGSLLQVGSLVSQVDGKIILGAGNGSQARLWSLRVPYGNTTVTDPNYDFVIRDETSGTDRFTINFVTGNVGIGTTSPAYILDARAPTAATGGSQIAINQDTSTTMKEVLRLTNLNSTDSQALTFNFGGTAIVGANTKQIAIQGQSNASLLQFIDSSSNDAVEIATSTSAAIGHGVYIREVAGQTQAPFLIQDSSGNSLVTVGPSGAVGIGTAIPSTLLHVYGGNLTVTGTGTTCVIGTGTGATMCSSDARLKKDVTPIANALDRLAQIRGVTFRWKDPKKDGPNHIGVIAQDVEKVFPEAVGEADGYKAVDMAALVAPLIEAVKELNADNDDLRTRLIVAKAMNADEIARINALTARVDALENRRTSPPR